MVDDTPGLGRLPLDMLGRPILNVPTTSGGMVLTKEPWAKDADEAVRIARQQGIS